MTVYLITLRSHDRRTAPKAVKFSNTVTEFPHYEEEGWSGGAIITKPVQSYKYSPPHSVNHSVNHSSSAHSSGHGHSLGQHADRSIPDGEVGLRKLDVRKTSADKQ